MTALTIAFLVRTIARQLVFLDPLRRAPRDHVHGATGVGKHGEISGLSYSVGTEGEGHAFGTKEGNVFPKREIIAGGVFFRAHRFEKVEKMAELNGRWAVARHTPTSAS